MERAQLRPLDVANLRDHIEQQISNAILNGVFRSGERLVESAVAETLGVSRAPVREALAALEREGLVFQVPRRGYFVVDLTDKDIEEIYSLRLLLEKEALRRAMDRVSEEHLAEMQRLVNRLGKAARELSDPETIVALDLEFHQYLCRVADHSRLCVAWNSLRLQMQMLIGWTSKTHYRYPDQPRELHQQIVDALRDQDLAQGEAVLTEHIADAHQRALMASRSLRISRAADENEKSNHQSQHVGEQAS
jgi:DNA-binding GntR family transcriptional regulator